jgi:hypothetical protein
LPTQVSSAASNVIKNQRQDKKPNIPSVSLKENVVFSKKRLRSTKIIADKACMIANTTV